MWRWLPNVDKIRTFGKLPRPDVAKIFMNDGR